MGLSEDVKKGEKEEMQMKGKSIFFMTAGIAILLCSGCKGEEGRSDLSGKVLDSFLTEVFTSDFEDRYTHFLEDNDVDKYYDTFSDYASNNCIEAMSRDRTPLKYDKKAWEESIQKTVSGVTCRLDKNGKGEFEVTLEYEQEGEKEEEKATGQISLAEKDGKKVDSFFLSNIVKVE